jgi:predicted O-methyltransferase YrrM
MTAGIVHAGPTEDRFTPPSAWCEHPEHWHSDDAQATEHEVSELVAAFARALQPEIVVETGTNSGQTAEAIGRALARSGHGHLYTLEADLEMAAQAALRCAGLPVTVLCQDSLSWTPPGEVGMAWLDSETGIRHLELLRLRPYLADGAIVGVHDTGPQHMTSRYLWPLIADGVFSAITLRTPRGVTFGTVAKAR